MEQTWRWFGPEDKISLAEIRQTGATGIVTALHHIPYGVVWSRDEVAARKRMIEAAGLRWSVVESLAVAEGIKLGEDDLAPLFANYRQSLRNLAAEGVTTVCYNFMPVVDWTRTQLAASLPNGGTALRFNAYEYAAFDCFMLNRPDAEAEQPPDVLAKAKDWIKAASEADKSRLLATIMAGLPGAYDRYDVPGLRKMLDRYRDIDRAALRQNLKRFLEQVVPTAEEVGVRLCIHPDDPPRPLFGLPRIVSSSDDLDFIIGAVDRAANGITLCTGSLGAGPGQFNWDGTETDGSTAPDGTYSISISAQNSDGSYVAASTETTGVVSGVDLSGSEPSLIVGSQTVKLSDVTSVEDTASTSQ